MGFKPFRFLAKVVHVTSLIGRPILALLGVKRGTAAGKAVEGAEILDPVVNPQTPRSPTSGKPSS